VVRRRSIAVVVRVDVDGEAAREVLELERRGPKKGERRQAGGQAEAEEKTGTGKVRRGALNAGANERTNEIEMGAQVGCLFGCLFVCLFVWLSVV
jgi:hypothetical protein